MGKVNKQTRKKANRNRSDAAKAGKPTSKALARRVPPHLKRKRPSSTEPPHAASPENPSDGTLSSSAQPRRRKVLSEHQQALQRKLESANFRMLNETLYTSTGARAFSLMQSDPSLFATYHTGYAQQTARWPVNPLDDVLSLLASEADDIVIADFGCGKARLARDARQRVHSFDLIASAPGVIACDMSRVPLPDCSINIAVFCLSLMGTNYGDYITEARRVLQMDGLLLVAEVASRFEHHDPKDFVKAVESLGFEADMEHPFVAGEEPNGLTDEGPSVTGNTNVGKAGKSSKGVKKRGGGKHKHKKKGTSQVKEQEAEKEQKTSAFFLKFAFRSTKESRDENFAAQRSFLPELAPCVYKKR